ncbi:hypothetical protein D0C16_04645 [Cellvibrio sp. KY-GH-1]|nr:hypothetical protein D0C16_04645 [Cellvibrio sp. KY-GH-1]
MRHTIPSSVIGSVASVLAEHYYSHSKINVLFMSAGASGEPPEGNLETKCSAWFKRCNDDEALNPLAILGLTIQKFMDLSPDNSQVADGQQRILESLAKNQLGYQLNGFINVAGASLATKSLADFFKSGDFTSVKTEFNFDVSNRLMHINSFLWEKRMLNNYFK